MNRITFLALGILISASACSPKINSKISQEDLTEIVGFLASDSLKGRSPGTTEDSVLLSYISTEFKSYGLKPLYDEYIQAFDLTTGIEVEESCSLQFKNTKFELVNDFYPIGFSASGAIEAPVLFCGYGIQTSSEKIEWNDYKNIDPSGKWVMMLYGSPENKEELLNFSRERDKVMLAEDLGAAGVIFVAGEKYSMEDKLETNLVKEPSIGIPVIQMTRSAASMLFEDNNFNITEIENDLQNEALQNKYMSEDNLSANIGLQKIITKTGNVAAILKGSDPVLSQTYIVVGAHHDHLGMGGKGNSSRMPDTIAVHNGADDNASGVASVLELASWFSVNKSDLKRSLIFITFGAEEKGLVGSKFFTENLPFNSSDIFAMVNIDMLGRLNADTMLQIGGVGTASEWKDMLENINMKDHFNLSLSEAGYGPSDHASFYTLDIPVLFFSTGPHQDYHTPYDDTDSVNFPGLEKATFFISEVVEELANMNSITFQEAGPKVSSGRSYRGSVTLGIMPDVSGDSNTGLKVLAVTPGKPAASAGMVKGDVIIALDNYKVENVYDYMYRLKTFKAGDSVVVTVLRENKEIKLLVYF